MAFVHLHRFIVCALAWTSLAIIVEAQVMRFEDVPTLREHQLSRFEDIPLDFGTPRIAELPDPTEPNLSFDTDHEHHVAEPRIETPSQFWWTNYVRNSILRRPTVSLTTNSLVLDTLVHAPQVSVLAARPQAAKTAIVEESARFDWSAFVESQWRDITEPIGNSLTTGGPDLFRNHQFTNEAGLRKVNRFGGELSVGQLFGIERSNSRFFVPIDQGGATLTIDYSQPLLQGAGRFVNESPVVLASLASDVADMEFVAQIQDYLTEVNRIYWELYFARANLLIERQLYHRAVETLATLEKRENVDASKEMILRAKTSLAVRKTRLVEARRRLLDQQTLLRNVVNSPELDSSFTSEFLPLESPATQDDGLSVEQAFTTAMVHRPEVARAIRDIRAAGVRYRVAENELLPVLNVVLQTYAKGLRGTFDVQQAFDDQFNVGEPAYSAGLQFEVPFGRRAANARLARRQIELAELSGQFRVEVERVLFDVVTQLRQLETTRRTVETNLEALTAATNTLDLLKTRYELVSPAQDGSASLRLQDMLNSHVRVADAEIALVRSQVDHALSMVRLRRAMGTLVRPTGVALPADASVAFPVEDSMLPGEEFVSTPADTQELPPPPGYE